MLGLNLDQTVFVKGATGHHFIISGRLESCHNNSCSVCNDDEAVSKTNFLVRWLNLDDIHFSYIVKPTSPEIK